MKFLLQVIVVISAGVVVGWGFARFAKGDQRIIELGDGKYEYDAPLEDPSFPAEAKLVEGQRLALVAGISKSSQVPEYLGVLLRKYQSSGLKVLVVLAPDSPKGLKLLTQTEGIPLVIDSDGRFQHLLRFVSSHKHGAVLLYDDKYRVKFHLLGMPDKDVLRQLVEKYLVGSITYRPSELTASSLIGKRVEGLECSAEPAPSKGVFVVFPPGCSSCEINGYGAQIKKARASNWGTSMPGEGWTLVFINGKDGHVVTQAQALGFSEKDICAVRQDILLDPYQTRKNPDTVPLVVRTNENGLIIEVRELTEFSSGGQK